MQNVNVKRNLWYYFMENESVEIYYTPSLRLRKRKDSGYYKSLPLHTSQTRHVAKDFAHVSEKDLPLASTSPEQIVKNNFEF